MSNPARRWRSPPVHPVSASASVAALGLNLAVRKSKNLPLLGFHDDEVRQRLRLRYGCLQLALGNVLNLFRQRQHYVRARSRCASPPSNQRCRASAITMIFHFCAILLSSSDSMPPMPFSSRLTKPVRAKRDRASDRCVDSLFGSRRLQVQRSTASFLSGGSLRAIHTKSARIPVALQALLVEYPGRRQQRAAVAGRRVRKAPRTPNHRDAHRRVHVAS